MGSIRWPGSDYTPILAGQHDSDRIRRDLGDLREHVDAGSTGHVHVTDNDGKWTLLAQHRNAFVTAFRKHQLKALVELPPDTFEEIALVVDDENRFLLPIGRFCCHRYTSSSAAVGDHASALGSAISRSSPQ